MIFSAQFDILPSQLANDAIVIRSLLVHTQMPWYTNLNIPGCKKSQCYNRLSFRQAVASIYL